MKKNFSLVAYVSLFILLVFVLLSVIAYINTIGLIGDSITIALIAALSAIISIIGSLFVSKQQASDNSRQQRALKIRETKQLFYNQFIEATVLKLANMYKVGSQEYKDADTKFCMERNRLPLYASQEIVEFVEKVASSAYQNKYEATFDFKTLYELIRKDLLNDELKEFKNLESLSVTLPGH